MAGGEGGAERNFGLCVGRGHGMVGRDVRTVGVGTGIAGHRWVLREAALLIL